MRPHRRCTRLKINQFITERPTNRILARSRYWKLTAAEVGEFSYEQDRLLNWEIKCVREPESAAMFVGVFLYRHGTPYNYEPVRGITYYYNNIPRGDLPAITKFLHDRYGGKEMEKGERIFLKDSREIYSGSDLAELAGALESELNAKAVISLEFDDMTHEELKEAGLPEAKLLPIPGK